MSNIKAPLKIRIKNSLSGFGTVMKQPKSIVIAFLVSFFMSGFIIWSLNFDLVKYILFEAPITAGEKARIFWDVQTGIYSAYRVSQASGIIVFSLLFGVNIAMITYVLKHGGFRSIPKKSGGGGLLLALLSGGCVACGTSILAPVFATLGATSSTFVSNISNILNWVGSILIIYSIYKLGGVINNIKSLKSIDK